MAEQVFEITRPGAKTTARFVGQTGFSLKPGEKVDVLRSQVDGQLALDVANGEFVSDPAMSRDEAAPDEPLNALTKALNDRDTAYDWEDANPVGAAGVTELEIVVVCADKDHANNPVNHALDGRRIQLDITAGSAEFDAVGGGQGPKIVTIKNGRGVAKLVVAAPITESQTVAMTDVDVTGLALPLDASVDFNA